MHGALKWTSIVSYQFMSLDHPSSEPMYQEWNVLRLHKNPLIVFISLAAK